MARNLLPIELHQLLVWKFPQAKSVTEACAAAAKVYGLSAETMRTYVYNGIGYRSKAREISNQIFYSSHINPCHL